VSVALAMSAAVPAHAASPTTVVTIGGPQAVHPIRPGFLGLSLEFRAVQAYAGTDPTALDPVFLQLVRNISPGQQPSIRIGGDSTDWAWWPTPSVPRPAGIRIDLTPQWLAVSHALAATLNAKVTVGINLEADNAKLAGTEARTFLSGIGPSRVQALELGNEPELYHSYGWYKNAKGDEVPGRPANWSFDRYLADYAKIERSLPRVTLAGPAIGSPKWLAQVGRFAKAQRGRVRVVTVHRYALAHCGTSSKEPSIADLLAPEASSGLAKTTVPLVAAAHAHGDSIRVDEMNTVSCGGAPGVSNAFASALWTVDALFAMARAGVDGVNVHTFSGATYGLFTFKPVDGVWTGFVKPQYYGMLLFAQAAPARSRLLRVSGASGPVRAWATRAPDHRTRVVLINDDPRHSRSLTVHIPGHNGGALVERLLAPRLGATPGVTLGGQSFGAATTSGQLAGTPQVTAIESRDGAYAVTLAAGSAALLTLR
jgi:Glycosyl hydrolase family 79 C-terminal beta domain